LEERPETFPKSSHPGRVVRLDRRFDLPGREQGLHCTTDCSEGANRSQPSVRLKGVAHTDSTAITIKINGFMSAEAAKTAAQEVVAKLAKADFS
jgi:hypothetical protein